METQIPYGLNSFRMEWNTNAIWIKLRHCRMERQMPYGLNSISVEWKHKCHMDWTPSVWNGNTNAIWVKLRERGMEREMPYRLNSASVEWKHKCYTDWTPCCFCVLSVSAAFCDSCATRTQKQHTPQPKNLQTTLLSNTETGPRSSTSYTLRKYNHEQKHRHGPTITKHMLNGGKIVKNSFYVT
jgi:hypothetical protein